MRENLHFTLHSEHDPGEKMQYLHIGLAKQSLYTLFTLVPTMTIQKLWCMFFVIKCHMKNKN